MARKIDAIKKVAVALGYGKSVEDFNGNSTVGVLKEIAVKMQVAKSVDEITAQTVEGVLNYIADAKTEKATVKKKSSKEAE